MAALNHVSLTGNLTKDLDLRYTARGTAVTELRLAVDAPEGEETVFLNVRFWGDLAMKACRNLRKGSRVTVEGRLQFESWTNRKTGKLETRLRVVGEKLGMPEAVSMRPTTPSVSQRRLPVELASETHEPAMAGCLF